MKKTVAFVILYALLTFSMLIGVSAKTLVYWTADDTTGSWGSTEVSAMETGKVKGAVSVTQEVTGAQAAPNIICYSLKGEAVGKEPLDLSAPEVITEGYVHLYVYISDIDEVILAEGNSVLELSSDGVKCFRWQLYDKLNEGWKELTLKFSDAQVDEGTEKDKISDMRIFQYGYSFTLAVDDITIFVPGEDEPEPTNPGTGSAVLPAILLCVTAGIAVTAASRKKIR